MLYDQYQRGFNRWSFSNEDLDLARYKGCRWTFYRHPDTDFIVYFTNNPPMKTNQFSAPLTTPGMLMRSKYKILIPSFKTRPRGRKSVSVRVRPPQAISRQVVHPARPVFSSSYPTERDRSRFHTSVRLTTN